MSWRQPARREQGGRRLGTGGDRAPGPGKLSASVALLGVRGSAGGCRAWDRQGRSRDGSGRAAGLGAEPRTPEARPRPERALRPPGPRPSDAEVCSEQLPGDKYNKVY